MARPASTERIKATGGRDDRNRGREPVLADIVDMGHLARYTMGDTALEKELLRMFAAQLRDLTANMRVARGPRHFRLMAHTLKGAARAIGAFGVARLASALEETGPGNAAMALLDELDRQTECFHIAFKSWEKSHDSGR